MHQGSSLSPPAAGPKSLVQQPCLSLLNMFQAVRTSASASDSLVFEQHVTLSVVEQVAT